MSIEDREPLGTTPNVKMKEPCTILSPPRIKRVVQWDHVFSLENRVFSDGLGAMSTVRQVHQLNIPRVHQLKDPPVHQLNVMAGAVQQQLLPDKLPGSKAVPYMNPHTSFLESLERHGQLEGEDVMQTGVLHDEYYSMGIHSIDLQDKESSDAMSRSPLTLPDACAIIILFLIGVFVMYQTYGP